MFRNPQVRDDLRELYGRIYAFSKHKVLAENGVRSGATLIPFRRKPRIGNPVTVIQFCNRFYFFIS